MGHQLLVQLESIAITIVWVRRGGLYRLQSGGSDRWSGRVPEEQEREGLDVNSHGENIPQRLIHRYLVNRKAGRSSAFASVLNRWIGDVAVRPKRGMTINQTAVEWRPRNDLIPQILKPVTNNKSR